MQTKLVLLLLSCLIVVNVYGQTDFKSLLKKTEKVLLKGNNSAGMDLSRQLIKLKPKDPRGYYYKGFNYFQTGKYDEAITTLKKGASLEKSPTYVFPYYIGLSFYKKEQYDSAIVYFNKSVEINPKDYAALLDLADSYYKVNSDSCIYFYNRAIEQSPKEVAPYTMKASYFYLNEEYQKSIPLFTDAISKDKNNHTMYFLRSYAKYMVDNHEGAIADVKKAIDMDPKDHDKYYYQGLYYMDWKQYKPAIEAFKDALSLDIKNIHTLYYLAYSQYQLDLYPEALSNIEKAILNGRDDSEVFSMRGYIRSEMNDDEGACEDWAIAAGKGCDESKELVSDYCESYLRGQIW